MTTESRRRILDEAEGRFAEHGYAGASLSSIARGAGLGNPGLIHHFPSKAALYRAVLEEIGADLDARDAAVLEVTGEPVDRLHGLVDVLLSLHRDRPTALMIIAQEVIDRSGRIDEAGVLPLAGVVRDTVAVLEAGQRAGAVRDGDPVAMTAALHGALLYGALGQLVHGRAAGRQPGPDWDAEIARSALASVLRGRA